MTVKHPSVLAASVQHCLVDQWSVVHHPTNPFIEHLLSQC